MKILSVLILVLSTLFTANCQSFHEFLKNASIDTGIIINLGNLNFQSDSAKITDPESLVILDSLFRFLHENPAIFIEVRGHTSNGPPRTSIDLTYLDNLSRARAEEIAWHLVSRGIEVERIQAKGLGPRKPITTNLTAEGRRKNQRVDLKIIKI